jgi:hypothetical protein
MKTKVKKTHQTKRNRSTRRVTIRGGNITIKSVIAKAQQENQNPLTYFVSKISNNIKDYNNKLLLQLIDRLGESIDERTGIDAISRLINYGKIFNTSIIGILNILPPIKNRGTLNQLYINVIHHNNVAVLEAMNNKHVPLSETHKSKLAEIITLSGLNGRQFSTIFNNFKTDAQMKTGNTIYSMNRHGHYMQPDDITELYSHLEANEKKEEDPELIEYVGHMNNDNA